MRDRQAIEFRKLKSERGTPEPELDDTDLALIQMAFVAFNKMLNTRDDRIRKLESEVEWWKERCEFSR